MGKNTTLRIVMAALLLVIILVFKNQLTVTQETRIKNPQSLQKVKNLPDD